MSLCSGQDSHSITEYAVEFQTLVLNLGWNSKVLQGAFHNGLSDQIMDKLAARDDLQDRAP